MALRLDHVELAAHDPQALARAYGVAGLALDERGDDLRLDGGKGRVALRSAEAPPRADRLRACDPGIAHICIQSTTPEATWRDLAAEGIVWNAELVGLGTGYTYAYGYDREGNLVELEGTGEAWKGRESWLAHVAIVTPDIDRATAFYTGLIGIAPHASGRFKHPNMGRVAALERVEARAAWIDTAALALELWHYMTPPTGARPPERPTGYRCLGFLADHLDTEAARIRDAGIALTVGGEGALLGEDPDGNSFRILAAD